MSGRTYARGGRGALSIRITAALAACLLASGLVVRLSVGLTSFSPDVRERIEAADGELALTSDAASTPLFGDVQLAPGQSYATCLRVSATGMVDPGPVGLHVAAYRGDPLLGRYVTLAVDRGEAGDRCAGFRVTQRLVAGALVDVAGTHHDARTAMTGWDPAAGSESAWYRLEVHLDEDAPPAVQGRTVDEVVFTWSTTGTPGQAVWLDRTLLLAGSLAEHSVVPLLIMLSVALLFIGVQDRIDRHDPKLALAPVSSEPVAFQ